MPQSLAIEAAVFDADDTLWESAVFYSQTLQRFADLMEQFQVSRQQTVDLVKKKDQERFKAHAFGVEPFNASLEELFLDRVPEADSRARELLSKILDDHYNHPLILLPGVREVLENLRQRGKRLFICTKGEARHQELKIKRSGLTELVDSFAVVKRKDEETFKALLGSWQVSRSKTLIVGDSYNDDILPMLKIGATAVYIPHPRTANWSARPKPAFSERLVVLKTVRELLDVVS